MPPMEVKNDIKKATNGGHNGETSTPDTGKYIILKNSFFSTFSAYERHLKTRNGKEGVL